jgi:hypothetical protein
MSTDRNGLVPADVNAGRRVAVAAPAIVGDGSIARLPGSIGLPIDAAFIRPIGARFATRRAGRSACGVPSEERTTASMSKSCRSSASSAVENSGVRAHDSARVTAKTRTSRRRCSGAPARPQPSHERRQRPCWHVPQHRRCRRQGSPRHQLEGTPGTWAMQTRRQRRPRPDGHQVPEDARYREQLHRVQRATRAQEPALPRAEARAGAATARHPRRRGRCATTSGRRRPRAASRVRGTRRAPLRRRRRPRRRARHPHRAMDASPSAPNGSPRGTPRGPSHRRPAANGTACRSSRQAASRKAAPSAAARARPPRSRRAAPRSAAAHATRRDRSVAPASGRLAGRPSRASLPTARRSFRRLSAATSSTRRTGSTAGAATAATPTRESSSPARRR